MTAIAEDRRIRTHQLVSSSSERRGCSSSRRKDKLLVVFTLGRLGFIPPIILLTGRSQAIVAALLGLFVAADIYDGVLARLWDADGPGRRALDSIADRVAIWPVFTFLTVDGYLSPLFLGLLVARDLYCGYWCYRMMAERFVVVRADWPYRSFNLLLAAWAVGAPAVSVGVRGFAFVLIMVCGMLVAGDLTRAAHHILASGRFTHGEVVSAGTLRGGVAYRLAGILTGVK
jgi:phosphatidylglycerophosphate synthase